MAVHRMGGDGEGGRYLLVRGSGDELVGISSSRAVRSKRALAASGGGTEANGSTEDAFATLPDKGEPPAFASRIARLNSSLDEALRR